MPPAESPLPVYLVYPYARQYPARLRRFVALMREHALPGVVDGWAQAAPAMPPAPTP